MQLLEEHKQKFETYCKKIGEDDGFLKQECNRHFEVVQQAMPNIWAFEKVTDTTYKPAGFDLAKIGLKELKDTVGYTLINLPNIKDIFCKTLSENYHYSLSLKDSITGNDLVIQIAELNISGKQKESLL